MMSNKSIIRIIITSVILISLTIWFLLSNTDKTDGKALEMLPSDASLIIEINKPVDFVNMNENVIVQNLKQIRAIEQLINDISYLDSILVDQPDYRQLLSNSPLTIGIYTDTNSVSHSIILQELGINPGISSIKDMLKEKLGRNYGMLDIQGYKNGVKIVDASSGVTQYLAFQNGVMIYTTSSQLLVNSYETYVGQLPKLLDDTDFNRITGALSSKSKARLYIQYSEFVDLVSGIVNDSQQNGLLWLNNFASWSGVDLMIKNKELIFSGFTIADSINYLSQSTSSQTPVELNALVVMPYNTNTLIWNGVSDYNSYLLDTYGNAGAADLSQKLNYDMNNFINVVGSEFAFISNATTLNSVEGNSWFIVKLKNKDIGASVLNRIAANKGKSRVANYSGYRIGKIDQSDFISVLFGESMGSLITENYFTIIGDYAVFGNTSTSIQNMVNYFETGKTLDLNDNYQKFSDNIATSSNILVYINPNEILNRLRQYFTDDASKKIEINEKVISSFQGLSFQLSAGTPMAFTTLYTNHTEGYHEENLSLWKVKLEDNIVSGPFLVTDHQTKSENVIVFDNLNNMYLINADGRILWERKIDGKPLGNIYEVDYYKNRKYQYLFNTADNIYLIDKNGKDVSGYPKKLHSKATNGVVVFDYLGNKDYRLIVAQSDKRVYNYNIQGKEVKGWNQPKMNNIVIDPVVRRVANNKDYIIITDIENEIKIVNRKGNRRIKLAGSIKKARNSNYYVNRTNSKGIIISTDKSGKLVYISSSGKLKYTDFGEFSSEHFFLYEDFNGDKSKDFIYIDGSKLKVFDRFKKVLFSYDFGSNITIPPSFFGLGGNQHVLGVVADQERTIYLFDKKGNIIISKGLVGETQFTVGDLQNNNKINLVSVAGNTLYNYRLR